MKLTENLPHLRKQSVTYWREESVIITTAEYINIDYQTSL